LHKYVSAAALVAAVSLAACGGGGGGSSGGQSNVLPTTTPPITGSSPQAKGVSATLSFALSNDAAATTSSSSRKPMTVSPSTKTFYLTVQNPDGSGNALWSDALAVNSTNCPSNCSYTVQLPIGADTIALLAVDANNVPLDYSGAIPFTVTANAPNAVTLLLSPIIANAVPFYAFKEFNGSSVSYPLVTLSALTDADGYAMPVAGLFNDGYPYSQINVSQTAGTFDTIAALNSGGGSYQIEAGPIAAGTSTTFPLTLHSGYVVETGNGTSSTFTTIVTFATPAVSFTATQFPGLPSTAVVPPSSNSISLTCQIPTSPIPPNEGPGGLAWDPCPIGAPVGITVR
jgi:hypothetical protein